MALGGGSMAQRNEGMAQRNEGMVPRHAKKRLGRTLNMMCYVKYYVNTLSNNDKILVFFQAVSQRLS